MKVFLSRPLDWQSRRAGRITRQLISASKRKKKTYLVVYHTYGVWFKFNGCGEVTKVKGRKIEISKGTRSPGGKAKFEKNFLKVCDILHARTVRQCSGKWRQGRGLRNGCQLSPPSGARCSATHGTLKGPVPPFTAILYICNQGKWFTASTTDNN